MRVLPFPASYQPHSPGSWALGSSDFQAFILPPIPLSPIVVSFPSGQVTLKFRTHTHTHTRRRDAAENWPCVSM